MRKHKYLYLFFFLWTCYATNGYSQLSPFSLDIEQFTTDQGLSTFNIREIFKDDYGFIWVATSNSLSRYDGYEFLHYNNSNPVDSLGSGFFIHENNVHHARLLNESKIVIEYRYAPEFLDVLDTRTNTVQKIIFDEANGFVGTLVDYFVADQQIYYLTESADSYHVLRNDENFNFHPMFDYPKIATTENQIINFFYSKRGTFWLATGAQIFQIDKDGETITSLNLESKQKSSKEPLRISLFQEDKSGGIWLAYQNLSGVFKYDEIVEGFELFKKLGKPQSPFFKLWEDDKNNKLFGTQKDELQSTLSTLVCLKKDQTIVDFSELVEKEDKVTSIYGADFFDYFFVASFVGLQKVINRNRNVTKVLYQKDIEGWGYSMRDILETPEGEIIFAREWNHWYRYNPETGKLRTIDLIHPETGKPIVFKCSFTLYLDDDNRLWGSGCEDSKFSFFRYDLNTDQLKIYDYPLNIQAFTKSTDGKFWLVCGKRLDKKIESHIVVFDPLNETFKMFLDENGGNPIAGIFPTCILESKDKTLWVGTYNGTFSINRTEQLIQYFTANNKENGLPSLSHDEVYAIHENSDGTIYFGTRGGLNILDRKKMTIKVLDKSNGMKNEVVYSILSEGNGKYWMGTNEGLSLYDSRDESFRNFTVEDGLTFNEFNRFSTHQDTKGRLYFGSMNGLNIFYPEALMTKQLVPEPILRKVTHYDGNKKTPISTYLFQGTTLSINIAPNDLYCQLNFTLPNYKNPTQNQYMAKLEGYDQDWIKLGNVPYVRYSDLSPGDYILKVKAADPNGNWSEKALTVPINVDEVFYKTSWFLGLCGLTFLGLIYGFFRYRLYVGKQREKTLETAIANRTQELAEEKRKSDQLLLNILPTGVAEELKKYGKAKAQRFESVTVFFSDFEGFSKISAELSPEDVVNELDKCFSKFDEIIDKYELEKIKTIGDAYMCAGGIPSGKKEAAINVVKAALEIQTFLKQMEMEKRSGDIPAFKARIGIHTGPVVAGIVGSKKFAYDIWGDSVNTASRMESNSETGKVNISQTTYDIVKDHFECEYRGKIKAKYKGEIDMYFVQLKMNN